MSGPVFQPANTVTIAAVSTSGNVATPSGVGGVLSIANAGTKVAFVALAPTSGATAAVTDYPVMAGERAFVVAGAATRIASICGGTDSTTLYVTRGNVRQD